MIAALVLGGFVLLALILPMRWVLIWWAPIGAVATPILATVVGGTAMSPLNLTVVVLLIRLVGRKRPADARARTHTAEILVLVLLLAAISVSVLLNSGHEGASNSVSALVVSLLAGTAVYLHAIPRYGITADALVVPWVVIALLSCGLQFVEFATEQIIVPESSAFFHSPYRNGEIRAQGLFPHPIVAGIMCTVAAVWGVLTSTLTIWARVAVVGITVAGALVTQSRSPLVAGGAALVTAWALRWLARNASQRRHVIGLLSIGAVLAGTFYLVANSATYIGGLDEAETSASYRFALVGASLSALAENPLGYGPGSIPSGVLLVDSVYGVLDLSQSIDNGYLLIALQYGVPVMALLVILLILLFYRTRGAVGILPTTLLVLLVVSGVFVAITSWAPYLLLFAQMIAATVASAPRAALTVIDERGARHLG